jgi:type II secretory pathway pseudopilin PulG
MTFLESIILLILGAVLTGFLIPLVFKNIDARKLREQKAVDERKLQEQKEVDERRLRAQKEFEADLARQSKVIESQVQLLENLAQLLWEYQLAAIEVSYFVGLDRDLYAAAVQRYHEKSGSMFSRIRAEISKALRLTPTATYRELKDLYYRQLLPLDSKLAGLIMMQQNSTEKRVAGWHEFNQFAVFQLSEMVDDALNNLARELRLKGHEQPTAP